MKLVYLTSQKFPSNKVEPFFHKAMAKAFGHHVQKECMFVGRGDLSQGFADMPTVSLWAPERFRFAFYFFRLPLFIATHRLNKKDVVFYSYDPYLLSLLAFFRSLFRFRYRIVSEWHQLFEDWRDAYIARHSDALITTSDRLRGLLCSKHNVPAQKVLVAYGGVDVEVFYSKAKIDRDQLRERLGLPKTAFLVGYMGRFLAVGMEKGLATMIHALSSLQDESTHMVFVGGSPSHIEKYRQLAIGLDVESRCIFVEKQPFETMVEYDVAMDALVIPYPNKPHFSEWGFPLKVWEYMAAGRPIIYSDLPVIREVLGNRATPFIPDDAKSLAEAVISVQRDKVGAEKIARQNVMDVQDFTWNKRAENILRFISV